MSTQTPFSPETVSVGAEGALAALANVGTRAEALVHAWVNASNAGAVQEAALRASGPARKAARRGLNVLKSRGVTIPAPIRRTPAEAPDAPIAYLLSPDSAGVGIVAICASRRGNAGPACLVYASEEQGVFRVENTHATPQKVKAQMAKVLRDAGYGPVEVPVSWARHRIAQSRKAHAQKGTPEPLGFMTAKPLLEPIPDETPEHPFVAEGLLVALDDAREMAKDSGVLHHWPEFRTWLPSQNAVRELLTRVGQSLPAGEQPDNNLIGETLRSEMLAATDRFFSPDVRGALVRRMRDAGISVLSRDGEAAALKVAATILVVESCGLSENTPAEVPFLRAFFEKAISYMMAQSGGKLDIPVPARQAS